MNKFHHHSNLFWEDQQYLSSLSWLYWWPLAWCNLYQVFLLEFKCKQEARGPHRSPEKTVQINKQIWLYHNIDSENKEKKRDFIGSSFEQTWIPFTQGCFVQRLVEIGPVVLEKKILKFRQCIFAICVIISPWKRAGLFIWTNLNPLHPRMLCAKFSWNRPSGSWEEDF